MKKEKKIKIDKNYQKELNESIKGVIGFALFFIFQGGTYIIPYIFGIDYSNLSYSIKQIYLISYCIIEMIIYFLLFKEELIKGFKDLKTNYKTYFKKYIKVWFIGLAVMYASNVLILMYRYKLYGDIGIATNEQNIRDSLSVAPLYIFFAASFYAPFVEELTFRHCFKKIFKNNILFVIISAFVFGGLHVFDAGMKWFDLLYLIPYCAPGVAFAYIYIKTNNITTTISLHLLHNTILITLQLIFIACGMM